LSLSIVIPVQAGTQTFEIFLNNIYAQAPEIGVSPWNWLTCISKDFNLSPLFTGAFSLDIKKSYPNINIVYNFLDAQDYLRL
jgi:hypothetical protein